MLTTATTNRVFRRAIVALGLTLTIHAASAAGNREPTPRAQDPPGVSAGWLDGVKQQIADAEYAVSWQHHTAIAGLDAAWQAPNRAQALRTYFTGTGIRVIPRSEAQPAWEWALTLVGYGRSHAVSAVETAKLSVDGARVEYDRGGIVEWYVNDRRGLEQGFTLAAPPSTITHDIQTGFVHIEMALGGTLAPVISADGQAIDFATANGVNVLRYAALAVQDARGQKLAARMEGFNGHSKRGIRIVFDDRDAVYPVTVDPLATIAAWTGEGNQIDSSFGYPVTTAGDVNGDGYSDVIVGAYTYDNGQQDEGRAFLYYGSASGLSTTAGWTAESDQSGGSFGYFVATAGDVNGDGYSDVIVSAAHYDNGQTDEGRAYVFHGSAQGLQAVAAWTAEGNQLDAQFGVSATTAGDVNGDGYSDVIVGAWQYTNDQESEGRAYVYHGSATGLQSTPAWTAEGNQANALFGASVATAGDVNGDGYADVIVGAFGYSNGQAEEGRAFVYHGSATGLQSTAAWTAESNQASASFGISVATAGDVNGDGYADVVVGAFNYDDGQIDEGRAYVYHGSAIGLQSVPAWTADGNQSFAQFGNAVATAGDVNGDGFADVIIGAFGAGLGSVGSAFVYQGSAGGLKAAAAWRADSDQGSSLFGISVATAGDVNGDGYSDVIVGAYYYENGQHYEGAAFVYHGSAAGLQTEAGWTADGDQVNDEFGVSVATAGDVNGDGYADVIVGADLYDDGFVDEGRAFVYLGSASGLAVAPAWTADGEAQSHFGISVATAGDVNGDGYSDVVVGSNHYSQGQTLEGRAAVYHGSAAGLQSVAAWTAEGNQAAALFGWSVATAGDVNGDGYSDVIVGAPFFNHGESKEGRTFVYHGSAAGLQTVVAWTAEGDQSNAFFGWSVATAGDVNGDGYSDVVVGARQYHNGELGEGRALVYHGSASGLQTTAAWTAEGNQADADFGCSVAAAGDVNGDGYADVIVGADLYDNGQMNEGRAFVYQGSATGLQTVAAWTAESDQASSGFGFSVASAGDVNGDGYADVVVGAHHYDHDQADEGRAFVYHGSAAGLPTAAAWTTESDQAIAELGYSVAAAGDVNGDGYSDVVVGARLYDNGEIDEGGVFIYYGNGGPGLSVRPQQRTSTDSHPIAPLGASDSVDSFRLALLARSPFGRGRVRLEWEVKPLGLMMNGLDTQIAVDSSDTGTTGAPLSQPVSDLIGVTPYHWRVRMWYDPVTTPFQPHSRWMRVPFGSWQEAMLRTGGGPTAAGSIPLPVVVAKAAGGQITLSWGASCVATDTDYAIYQGALGNFTSHGSLSCSTGGATTTTFSPLAGDAYYLIVPLNAAREGSYGADSAGVERVAGQDACLPRLFAACQ